MDPNQSPNNQPGNSAAQPPQPAAAPDNNYVPQPNLQNSPPAIGSYGAPLSAPVTASGSQLPLILGIAAIVVVLLGSLLLGWFLFFSPAAQSKRLSNKFMQSITAGDVTKAAELSGDPGSKAFLTTASANVKGTFKLSRGTYTGDKGYYVYTLNGAAKKYARTIIAKENNKRVVSSFVYSNSELQLVPSASTASAPTPVSSPAQASSPAPGSPDCLTRSDYSYFSNLGIDFTKPNEFAPFAQLHFNPDAATYVAGQTDYRNRVFEDFKNFYANTSAKKYTIQLSASVNSTTPDEKLAAARNSKVMSDLQGISGIPSSKVTIMPSTKGDPSGNAGDTFNRQVQIKVSADYSCPII